MLSAGAVPLIDEFRVQSKGVQKSLMLPAAFRMSLEVPNASEFENLIGKTGEGLNSKQFRKSESWTFKIRINTGRNICPSSEISAQVAFSQRVFGAEASIFTRTVILQGLLEWLRITPRGLSGAQSRL